MQVEAQGPWSQGSSGFKFKPGTPCLCSFAGGSAWTAGGFLLGLPRVTDYGQKQGPGSPPRGLALGSLRPPSLPGLWVRTRQPGRALPTSAVCPGGLVTAARGEGVSGRRWLRAEAWSQRPRSWCCAL